MYWHENQFEYPNKKAHYIGFKELQNFISSDVNIFNSNFHRDDFYKKAKKELKKFNLNDLYVVLEKKYNSSFIVYPGFDMKNIDNQLSTCRDDGIASSLHQDGIASFGNLSQGNLSQGNLSQGNLSQGNLSQGNALAVREENKIILWNHRWSKDKDYFMFFSMMRNLKKNGYKFKLNIFGETVLANNDDFIYFKKQMGDYINKFGFLSSKLEYYKEVSKSDIVISTAIEENFGISIVESMYLGATPILPNRLSYPELIPIKYHNDILYNSYDDALFKIKYILNNNKYLNLSDYMNKYDIRESINQLNEIIKNLH